MKTKMMPALVALVMAAAGLPAWGAGTREVTTHYDWYDTECRPLSLAQHWPEEDQGEWRYARADESSARLYYNGKSFFLSLGSGRQFSPEDRILHGDEDLETRNVPEWDVGGEEQEPLRVKCKKAKYRRTTVQLPGLTEVEGQMVLVLERGSLSRRFTFPERETLKLSRPAAG